jgi:hypothetical protein
MKLHPEKRFLLDYTGRHRRPAAEMNPGTHQYRHRTSAALLLNNFVSSCKILFV